MCFQPFSLCLDVLGADFIHGSKYYFLSLSHGKYFLPFENFQKPTINFFIMNSWTLPIYNTLIIVSLH